MCVCQKKEQYMAKADRYTADGREAIAKAREADVEDRTYQIGEISQKTGLQKTAEGWVTPKVDKKLAKEIANSNHFEEQQKAAKKAKRDEELHRQRAEGEANAEAYRKRYEEEHGGNTPLQHTSASQEVQKSVYKDIKNNGLEDYTVEEIAKEYGTTRGDKDGAFYFCIRLVYKFRTSRDIQ